MSAEVQIHERLSLAKTIPLGLQHVFAMFGATVTAVMGGITILLFGMIGATGLPRVAVKPIASAMGI